MNFAQKQDDTCCSLRMALKTSMPTSSGVIDWKMRGGMRESPHSNGAENNNMEGAGMSSLGRIGLMEGVAA